MKRALVFSGGGSRGAYEIGAWQAMTELGVRFDGMYGASIGAINAALAAQGDLEVAIRLWENIRLKEIVATDEEDFSVDRMISKKRDVIPFLLENKKYLRMDVAPLRALIDRTLKEGRVRASGLELGIMTVRAPQMQSVPMRLKNMPQGRLTDWIMASAACFPVFPLQKIDGERYLDGGYYDNLPIDMALADGMEEIIAVDVHPQPAHPEYLRMPFLKMIHPRHEVGGFLDFDSRVIQRARRMGYYDAMKAYQAMDGIRYTFRYRSDLSVNVRARRFMQMTAKFDAEAITRAAFKSSQPMNAPLIAALERESVGEKLTWKQAYLRGLELCAEKMEFREDALYDPDQLTERIMNYARRGEAIGEIGENSIHNAARMGSRELISYLYRVLCAHGKYPENTVRVLAQYPDETAAALYLYCAACE